MIEILAPCGSFEALNAALRSGADAVYLGGEDFSARQNAANFSDEELVQAVRDCHVRNVKVYLAVNTMLTDEQLEKCAEQVEKACELGVDGLITQDLALVEIVRNCCPQMEIHSSTQMTIHTERGAMLAKNMGFSRVVLSRELSFDKIAEIAKLPIETEIFVHGALCMSVSGQCFMSAVIGSRSANRGLCAQPCRLPMSPIKGREDHVLSLKDMCGVDFVQKLEKEGVNSLKIEGRMKRPEYVASAVHVYKSKLNGESADLSLLENVFSRSGFTDGYFKGKTGKEMFGIRTKEDVTATAKALPKLHELYRREYKRSKIKVHCKLKENQPFEITASDESGVTVTVLADIPQTAINRPCDDEMLRKHLSKLGDTIYTLESLTAEIDGNLMLSASQLNSSRRLLIEKLDNARTEKFTRAVPFDRKKLSFDLTKRKRITTPQIRISVNNIDQLESVDINDLNMIVMPLNVAEKAAEKGLNKDKIAVSMPRFTFNEKGDFERLKKLNVVGFRKIMCTNLAHISMGKELGMEIHNDFGFNAANSLAIKVLEKMGVKDVVVSFELKAAQINRLSTSVPIGIIAYGRLPLMLTANCPIKQSMGCGRCTGRLFDRTGREFPVKCSKSRGYVEILNSEVLYLADKLNDFSVDFIRLDFYDENPRRVSEIVSAYKNASKSDLGKITRGLYYRGVK